MNTTKYTPIENIFSNKVAGSSSLRSRALNLIKKLGTKTAEELVENHSLKEISMYKAVGPKTINHIVDCLNLAGFAIPQYVSRQDERDIVLDSLKSYIKRNDNDPRRYYDLESITNIVASTLGYKWQLNPRLRELISLTDVKRILGEKLVNEVECIYVAKVAISEKEENGISGYRLKQNRDDQVSKATQLNKTIKDLELGSRTYECLTKIGLNENSSVVELTKKTESDLLSIRGLGRTALRSIKGKLFDLGLYLK